MKKKGKRYSEETIVRILHEAERGEASVKEICHKHGVSEWSFYRWRKRFGGLSVDEARRLRALEKENSRLKKLLAERDLDIEIMKEVAAKKW